MFSVIQMGLIHGLDPMEVLGQLLRTFSHEVAVEGRAALCQASIFPRVYVVQ